MSSPLVGRRVVIVDDDPSQASTLATLLRLEGIEATHEDTATAALARLLVEPPDVVVIDVKMPELSGTDLLAKLRAKHPRMPAVLLTGYEEHDPRLGCALDSGRVAYVAKPLVLPELLDALVKLLTETHVPPTASGPVAWSR